MKYGAVAIVGALLFASCSSDTTTRNDAGEVVEGGEVGVFAVQIGDCINFPTDQDDGVDSFGAVACTEPHDGQIFELFDITGFDEFPGNQVVSQESDAGCFRAFESFVGLDVTESRFLVQRVSPSEQTWNQLDDREVICIVLPPDGDPPLTMSLEGVAQ